MNTHMHPAEHLPVIIFRAAFEVGEEYRHSYDTEKMKVIDSSLTQRW